jgi:hypothetical protein
VKVLVLALGLATLASCTLRPKGDGDGGAGGGSGGEAQGGADEGGQGQGEGGATCADLVDCDTCRTCAAQGVCGPLLDQCLDNPVCVAIDECLAYCGATFEECWETCRAQNAAGLDEYDAVRQCLDCVECPDTCATPAVCGG